MTLPSISTSSAPHFTPPTSSGTHPPPPAPLGGLRAGIEIPSEVRDFLARTSVVALLSKGAEQIAARDQLREIARAVGDVLHAVRAVRRRDDEQRQRRAVRPPSPTSSATRSRS